ncbi:MULTISPECIES: hypothetical protein [unclassified Moorena]|nr:MULTISPECIES: hypothetical protein [unclassified Moorena]NEO04845.1 hypothetical protein [Moorena sp. SIO3I8]NEO19547.1 hypothetical protein [Moorena sp. SIO4A5]NEQ60170.1 hypothetical protein [Moorena sp. SIO4A1]
MPDEPLKNSSYIAFVKGFVKAFVKAFVQYGAIAPVAWCWQRVNIS